MNGRNSGDRRCFAPNRVSVIHREILSMDLFRSRRPPETRIKFGNEDSVGTERLDLICKGFVESLDNRNHEDHSDHADADAQNCQCRTELVGSECINGHKRRFFEIFNSHVAILRDYSDRNASMGSSRAARQAGQSPLMIPTIDDTPTPSTAEAMLMSNGK